MEHFELKPFCCKTKSYEDGSNIDSIKTKNSQKLIMLSKRDTDLYGVGPYNYLTFTLTPVLV